MIIITKLLLILAFLITVLMPVAQGQDLRTQQRQDPALQQRQQNERLALEFYRNQEYEKAVELYAQLFEHTRARHHYNYYLNALLQLERLDEAETLIKTHSRQAGYAEQSEIELGYVYLLKGQTRKAERTFSRVLRNLPPDRNRISRIANTFLNRGLPDYALQAYAIASDMPQLDYPFYLEAATAYQFAGNHEKMVENLLDHANYNPSHFNLVKTRLQNLLRLDVDHSISEMIRRNMLVRAQENPNNVLYSEMLIWFALQQKDYEIAMIQAMALDRRFGDKDNQVLELAEISLSNHQFEVAQNGFTYIVSKGRQGIFLADGLKGLLKTRFMLAESNPASDESVYRKLAEDINKAFTELGFNRQTYELVSILANIHAFHLNEAEQAVSVIEDGLRLPLRDTENAELKMQLADILLLQDQVWEATLLYSQVEKAHRNSPIGHEARFRNARLRFYIGEFGWAQNHLDVLKAATSKLIANDAMALSLLIRDNLKEDETAAGLRAFAHADLLVYQRKDEQALNLLDSLAKTTVALGMADHILLRKADIFARAGKKGHADSLYRQLYTLYPKSYLADLALYQSALLNENELNNPEKARELFGRLFDEYPASLYAAEARRKYRQLRGDAV